MFDKKYKYTHFCGNELMANEIYTATAYARLYHGYGRSRKAISYLLPHLFYNGYAQKVMDTHPLFSQW